MVQIHPPLPITMIKRDIEAFLTPIIEETGCELWGIEFGSAKGKGRLLRIYIDAIHGVDINDCTKVSREIDYYFQHESIFSEFAFFEVSSPGLDRKLFNQKQYKKFVGDVVSLSLFSKVNNLRKLKGTLLEVLDSEISVKTEGETLLLELSNIEVCKLDLDDQIEKKRMNKQILDVVASVSIEKGVDKTIIFQALEEAIASATKKLVDDEANIDVVIDTTTGEYKTYRKWDIVKEIDESEVFQVLESDLDGYEVDEATASKEIENIDFGRISAQAAKQVIIQKVREAERSKITKKYENLVGEVISGQVKRINRDFLLLEIEEDLNAQIPRDQIIPGEIFKLNDRVRAVIKEIVSTPRGPQIILSRTDERLVVQLFTQEVPEISEGTIEIKAIARDPGYRSKIAVKTYDGRIDPVGACVGMRGSRVQAVSNEIGNERIDIFIHSDNPAEFVVNCLAPVKIYSILVDERTSTLILEVEEENQAQIIGKNGQNLRLMTHMIGWSFQVLNKEQFKEYQDSSLIEKYDGLAKRLDLSDKEKEGIVSKELDSLEKIVDLDSKILAEIFGNEKRTTELLDKANELLLQDAFNADFNDPTMEEDLVNLNGITNEVLSALSSNNIKKLEDLAEMSVGELQDISETISEKEASALIMEARKPWFE